MIALEMQGTKPREAEVARSRIIEAIREETADHGRSGIGYGDYCDWHDNA